MVEIKFSQISRDCKIKDCKRTLFIRNKMFQVKDDVYIKSDIDIFFQENLTGI